MIEIYTTPNCIYCVAAKAALDARGLEYTVINVLESGKTIADFKDIANGATSVPQIVINEDLIGGYDQLIALIRDNKLNALLEISK